MKRSAFSMIELIFVIVIMGIIGKFGVEFLAQSYKNFIFTSVNHTLQSNSATAVEFISTRLQYRIKDSVIARKSGGSFIALGSVADSSYTILEWVGSDIDNFRADGVPNWSGIIDINHPSTTNSLLISPATNTNSINNLINILSNGNSAIDDAALYFIGSNSDITTGYGWNGDLTSINSQTGSMHPITSTSNVNEFAPDGGTFKDVYEYYKLAWTAYAVVHNGTNLTLYYDYQPWEGESYTDGKSSLLMKDVETFQFMAIGSIIKIQVCVNSKLVEDYSLCKEKTIF